MFSIQLYFIQLVFEIWEVFLNGIPDLIKVDSEILMNENIPHSDNLIPRGVGNCSLNSDSNLLAVSPMISRQRQTASCI